MHLSRHLRTSSGSEPPNATPFITTREIPFIDHLKPRCDCSASTISRISSKSSASVLLPFKHCFGDFQKNANVETLHECTSFQPSMLPSAYLVGHQCAVSRTPEHAKLASPMASKSSIIHLLQARRNRFVPHELLKTSSSGSSKVPFVNVFVEETDSRLSQALDSSNFFKLSPGVCLKHENQLPRSQEHNTILSTTASVNISAAIISKETPGFVGVQDTHSKLSYHPSSISSVYNMKHSHGTKNSWKSATASSTSSSGALSSTISSHIKRLVGKVEPLKYRIENRIEEHREARQVIKKRAKDNAPPKKHILRATKSNDLASVLGHLKATCSSTSISVPKTIPDVPKSGELETLRLATPLLLVPPTSEYRTPIRPTTTDEGDEDIFYTPASRMSKNSVEDADRFNKG